MGLLLAIVPLLHSLQVFRHTYEVRREQGSKSSYEHRDRR